MSLETGIKIVGTHPRSWARASFEGRNSLGVQLLLALPLLSSLCRFAGWVWTSQENLTPKSAVGGRSHPQQPDWEALCCSCCTAALPETSFPWSCSSWFRFQMNHCSWKTKKCSLHFFNRWLLSPSKHSFPALALLNYSIPASERATVPLVGRGSSV